MTWKPSYLRMKPVGLTMKNGRNKYRLDKRGELLLIHQCTECETLSINRIAADDDPSTIIRIFEASVENQVHVLCEPHGVLMLNANDADALYKQLYGGVKEVSVAVW